MNLLAIVAFVLLVGIVIGSCVGDSPSPGGIIALILAFLCLSFLVFYVCGNAWMFLVGAELVST